MKSLVHKNRMMASVIGVCEHCGKATAFVRSVRTFLDHAKARCSYCGKTFDLTPEADEVELL